MNIVIKTANAMNCIEETQKVIAAGYSRYCLRQHELMRKSNAAVSRGRVDELFRT